MTQPATTDVGKAANAATAPGVTPAKPEKAKRLLPFGEITFRMDPNPKSYPDKSDPSKSSARIGYADAVNGDNPDCLLNCSIYLETVIVQHPTGQVQEQSVRLSMPKGWSLRPNAKPETAAALAAWKDSTIDAFLAARKAGTVAIIDAGKGRSAHGVRRLE